MVGRQGSDKANHNDLKWSFGHTLIQCATPSSSCRLELPSRCPGWTWLLLWSRRGTAANETGNCIADIVFGHANPSGKLSQSCPKHLLDVPTFLSFLTETDRTLCGEDVYVGYRYYDFADREVNFPFGNGLSYTTFGLSDLKVSVEEGNFKISLAVINMDNRKGVEIAQLYMHPKQAAKNNKPVKELRGFAKVELEAGQSKTVTIKELEEYAAAHWDEERDQWCAEKGEYEVIVSDNNKVTEGKAVSGQFTMTELYWWLGI